MLCVNFDVCMYQAIKRRCSPLIAHAVSLEAEHVRQEVEHVYLLVLADTVRWLVVSNDMVIDEWTMKQEGHG